MEPVDDTLLRRHILARLDSLRAQGDGASDDEPSALSPEPPDDPRARALARLMQLRAAGEADPVPAEEPAGFQVPALDRAALGAEPVDRRSVGQLAEAEPAASTRVALPDFLDEIRTLARSEADPLHGLALELAADRAKDDPGAAFRLGRALGQRVPPGPASLRPAASPVTPASREHPAADALPEGWSARDERDFQRGIRQTGWYREFVQEYGEEPDLDTPAYDYRTAWKVGQRPERNEHDGGRYHWPSTTPDGRDLKSLDHPTYWKQRFLEATGQDPDALGLASPEDAAAYLRKGGMGQGGEPPAPAVAVRPGGEDRPETSEELRRMASVETDPLRRRGLERLADRRAREEELASVTLGERLGSAGAAVAQGAASVAASLPKSVAVLAGRLNELLPEFLREEDFGPAEDRLLYNLGEAVEAFVAEALPTDPRLHGQFVEDVLPRAIGSMLGFLAGGAAGRALRAGAGSTTAVLGAGAGAAEQYEVAREAGTDEETAQKAGALGAVLGTSEALPISRAFGRLARPGRVVPSGLAGATEETVQEVAQGVGGNVVARDLYDPDRGVLSGTGEGGAAGGIVGFLTSAAMAGLGRRLQLQGAGQEASQRAQEPTEAADALPVPREAIGQQGSAEAAAAAPDRPAAFGPPAQPAEPIPNDQAATGENQEDNRTLVDLSERELRRITGGAVASTSHARNLINKHLGRSYRAADHERIPVAELTAAIEQRERAATEAGALPPEGTGAAVEVPPGSPQDVRPPVEQAQEAGAELASLGAAETPGAQPEATALPGTTATGPDQTSETAGPDQEQAADAMRRRALHEIGLSDLAGVSPGAASQGAAQAETPGADQRDGAPAEPGAVGERSTIPTGDGSTLAVQGLDVGDLPKQALALLRREFTSRGDLPEGAFKEKIRRDGRTRSVLKRVEYTLADFDRAAREVYGKSIPVEEVHRLDGALKGEVPVDELPAPLQPVVRQMRTHIDALSDAMIRTGAAAGDLALTIKQNKGVYLTRTYRVFDDPKWAKKVPQEVRTRAETFIRRENPDLSEEEVAGRIEALLYREESSPFAALSGGKLGAKDLSITRRRKDLPEELRALLGEYKDPRVNYVRSMARMAGVVSNQQFLNQVRADGLGRYLFEQPVVQDGVAYQAQLAGDASQAMSPLNGLYTTPEIRAAFVGLDQAASPDGAYGAYLKALALTKAAKTVYSPMTQATNLLSNVGFAVAQAHWRATGAGKAAAGVLRDLRSAGTEAQRQEWQKLVRLGVVDESVRAGEMEGTFRDASFALDDVGAFAENGVVRGLRGVARGAQQLYQAGDNVWKVYAFHNERARYREALPEASEEEVDQRAVEVVRRTYPVYSLVPSGVRRLRRNPLVGTFVSFPAEVVRTSYGTLRQIQAELQDPRLRRIGLERLAGTLTAATAAAAATAAGRALMGMTADDDRDARRFMPPWHRTSQILYTGRDDDGRLNYVDLGRMDPYSYIKEPVLALLRGDDRPPLEVAVEIGAGLLEPFVSEEILTEKVLDVARNQTKDGRPVYNPEAPEEEILQAAIGHLYEGIEPGAFTSARRIMEGLKDQQGGTLGTKRDPGAEAVAVATGVRQHGLDVERSLSFKARDLAEGLRSATRLFTSAATQPGPVSEEALQQAYEQAEEARRRLHDEAHRDAQAAIRLGVPEETVFAVLAGAGLSARLASQVIEGVYEPYVNSRILEHRIRGAEAAGNGEDAEELRRRQLLLLRIMAGDAAGGGNANGQGNGGSTENQEDGEPQ